MEARQNGKTQKIAAAQIGFCERSAYNIEKRGFQEAKPVHNWCTRKDPFKAVWETEIVPLLTKEPHLQARTVLEELQRNHIGEYPNSNLRTLQRKVRKWKAFSGPEKEIIFRQKHPPGWQGMSDFTNANSLKITIQGVDFKHLLYHYRLVYSKWEAVFAVEGGESFSALAEGLQNALWLSGGVPQTHRTDSLSAAYKNCSDKTKEDFTESYALLCAHYRMKPTRNNKSLAWENGAIESSHGDLKNRIRQALMLRGSKNFSSIDEYKHFIRELTVRHNQRIHKRYLEELSFLKKLPNRKTTDFAEKRVRVTTSSTICVYNIVYSVPSRLIGMILKVHIYDSRLECFIGNDFIIKLERKRRKNKRVKQINYRHVIGALCRKPQAFRNYIHKEELLPTETFRQTWELLNQKLESRAACSEYVKILKEAAENDHEAVVENFLKQQLQQNMLPKAIDVQKLFRKNEAFPKLELIKPDLKSYAQLLGEAL